LNKNSNKNINLIVKYLLNYHVCFSSKFLLLIGRNSHMSFKTWSAAQDAPGKSQANDKAKTAPAVAQPAAQPDKIPEKPVTQGPAPKKA
jgi:hypothetical protein